MPNHPNRFGSELTAFGWCSALALRLLHHSLTALAAELPANAPYRLPDPSASQNPLPLPALHIHKDRYARPASLHQNCHAAEALPSSTPALSLPTDCHSPSAP